MTWLCFLCLTALHIFSNFRAISAIAFQSINRQRGEILINHYLKAQGRTLLSPQDVSSKEAFVLAAAPWHPLNKIKLGAPLERMVADEAELWTLSKAFSGESFMGKLTGSHAMVAFHVDARQADVLKAFFFSVCAMHCGTASEALVLTRRYFSGFHRSLEAAGWKTDHFLLGATEWRAIWPNVNTESQQILRDL